jgi:hypothetical protein
MGLKTLLLCTLLWVQAPAGSAPAPPAKAGVLSAAEVQPLLPEKVYFSGQLATVQMRNSGGVRGSGGKLTLFAMVDSSGYSTGVRERYQFYLLTDSGVEIAGQRLNPGAYGAGFMNGPGFEVMDLGGHELFHAPYLHDAAMARPRPLQVVPGGAAGEYRLYLGRDYVAFHQIAP